jgi:membrane protein YqaA with SNARE-associated domain
MPWGRKKLTKLNSPLPESISEDVMMEFLAAAAVGVVIGALVGYQLGKNKNKLKM